VVLNVEVQFFFKFVDKTVEKIPERSELNEVEKNVNVKAKT
jgi:hypothetical protein